MTPKKEREWAQDILKRIQDDAYFADIGVACFMEFGGMVKALAENQSYIDRSYYRKVTSTFENILWLREYQNGDITKDELVKRLTAKGQALAENRLKEQKICIERQDKSVNP